MPLQITTSAIAAIIAAAQEAAPAEACGILLGSGSRIEQAVRATNVAQDPLRHFEVDPVALIAAHKAARAGGPEVLGYFHSHPGGLSRPSTTDADSAAHDGKVWAIAACAHDGQRDKPWAITCWHDGPNGFEALSYAIIAG